MSVIGSTESSPMDLYSSSDESRQTSAISGKRKQSSQLFQQSKRWRGDPVAMSSGSKIPQAQTIGSLPEPVWQHVFTFLPPLSLARIIRVNKAFRGLLTENAALSGTSISAGALNLRNSEEIWAVSRQRHYPSLPRPLASLSELDSWKLLGGRSCQFCGKVPKATSVTHSHWKSGPGEKGIRIVWSFGIRSCGRCLFERVQKVTLKILSIQDVADSIRGHTVAILPHRHFLNSSLAVGYGNS